MYWFRLKHIKPVLFITGFILFFAIQSCQGNRANDGKHGQFFDLKKYFKDESGRLARVNPLITKKAVHNSNAETKKLHIANWENEFSIFAESDINKPAWKASYTTATSEGITTYTATDPDLKTRYIIIKKQQDKVKLILIYNSTKTTLFGKALYWTTEYLSYVPDSMYRIQKSQYVRSAGLNKYSINGIFN